MTPVDLCNQALGRIGHSMPIQSLGLTDKSEAGLLCGRLYAPTRRALLTECFWPFSLRCEPLALLPDKLPGFVHAYAYPADALHVHAVLPASETVRRRPWKPAPFTRVGQMLGSDVPGAWAHYVADVEADKGGALFCDVLVWRLATELALALKADPRLAQFARDQAMLGLSRALAVASNEEQHEAPLDAENIEVRQ